MSGDDNRYLLLCRHARHIDGKLLPVKNSLEQWVYPTDSVGRVLAEELAIHPNEVRLGKILWADTSEAKETAALLLQRLANASGPVPQLPNDKAVIKWPSGLPQRDCAPEGRQVPCASEMDL